PRRNQGRTGAKVTGADAVERRATTRSIAILTPLLVAIALTPCLAAAQQEDLRVLNGGGGPYLEYVDAPNSLYRHLQAGVDARLDAREQTIASLITSDDWAARRDTVRATLLEVLGPFPERTPLNARVTGSIEQQ